MSGDTRALLRHFPAEYRGWVGAMFRGAAGTGISTIAGVLAGVRLKVRARMADPQTTPRQQRELERLRSLMELMREETEALAGAVLAASTSPPPPRKRRRSPSHTPPIRFVPQEMPPAVPKPPAPRGSASPARRRGLPPTTAQLERLQALEYRGAWPRTRREASEQIQRLQRLLPPAERADRLRAGYQRLRPATAKQVGYLRHLGYAGVPPPTSFEASELIRRMLQRRENLGNPWMSGNC